MFLVVGLAVAGLAGIAAAFYFSIRSGNGRDRRLRSAGAAQSGAARTGAARTGAARTGAARTGAARAGAARSGAARAGAARSGAARAGAARTGAARAGAAQSGAARTGAARTGAARAGTGHGRAGLPPGSRVAAARPGRAVADHRLGDRPEPDDTWADGTRADDSQVTEPSISTSRTSEFRPGSRSAARLSRQAHAAADETRPRRRVGFRKGADLDEELWPVEAFGGVSDEQFWDDVAADKPLATTARAAQPDSETRRRPLDTGPATDPQPLHATGEDRVRGDRVPGDRVRGDRVRGDGRRGAGPSTDSGTNYGAYPGSRTVPNPATERTMIQPAYTATQPVPTMTPQVPAAPQPPQPPQPAETRGRRRASSAEEDPLTSAAFALRASGPVDGRSFLRSGGSRSGGSGTGPASTYGGISYAGASYGDYDGRSAATQAMSTPPSGQDYGYASRGTVPPGGDPRRQNDSGSHARHAGMGEQTRPVRQVRPQDSYQGTGSYPLPGYPGDGYRGNGYPATGGYQAGEYQGNGQPAPYDPRDDYRRLTYQS